MNADVLFVGTQLFRRKRQKHVRFMDGALNSVDVSLLLKFLALLLIATASIYQKTLVCFTFDLCVVLGFLVSVHFLFCSVVTDHYAFHADYVCKWRQCRPLSQSITND